MEGTQEHYAEWEKKANMKKIIYCVIIFTGSKSIYCIIVFTSEIRQVQWQITTISKY